MPSFQVEVVAESVPLTEKILLDVLLKAASSDPVQIKTAAQQLQNWERTQGYYSGLQSIFADVSLPLELRHLAIISLKNGIDKYWRKTATNALSKEEKTLIRSRCIQFGLQEPSHRLAVQNALVVAKVVRYEFPHDWPDAVPSITNAIQEFCHSSAESITLPRILLIALYVIKQLSTATIQRARMNFFKVAPQLLKALAEAYQLNVSRWMVFMTEGGADQGGAIASIDQSLLALRAIRRLAIAGYERPHDELEIHEIWTLLGNDFGSIFPLVANHSDNLQSHIRQQLERHLLQISKLHLNMVQKHPISFPQLPGSIAVARSYWDLILRFSESFGAVDLNGSFDVGSDGDAEDEITYLEQLSLKGLLLLRACVKTAYHPIQTFKYLLKAEKEERNHWVDHLKTSFFNESLVMEMMQTLVTKFFVFRPSDLREWETEPDEWVRVQEGEGEAWEHSVRVCSEKLFLDLVLNNKPLLIQPLLASFHAVGTTQCKDIRLKDSVYGAIGLSAAILDKDLDFNSFMTETLVPEVQIQGSNYRMLRRRVAILIEQWSSVVQLNRPVAYEIFKHLLNPSDPTNDHVVRVTAARQLRFVIDQWNCSVDDFVPHSPEVIDYLLGIIPEVTVEETKLAVLHTVQVIVERMGRQVAPLAERIVKALSDLWAQAESQSLRKNTILDVLKTLMDALNESSDQWHGLVLPLTERCVDPSADDYYQMVEDGIALWLAVVSNAERPTPQLMDLTRCLSPLYDVGLEALDTVLELSQAYIIIDPESMVRHSRPLLADFSRLLQNKATRAEPKHQISRAIEMQIQLAQSRQMSAELRTYVEDLHHCGVLRHMIRGLRSTYEADEYTGPSPPTPLINIPEASDYFCILARIAYASPETWSAALAAAGDAIAADDPGFDKDVVTWLIQHWFNHFSSLSTAVLKKLSCLGLTNLLLLQPGRMPLLQQYLTMWTETCRDCCEELPPSPDANGASDIDRAGKLGRDTLVWQRPGPWTGAEDERPKPGDRRVTELEHDDPVHSVSIRDFVAQALRSVMEACGGYRQFEDEWLVNVDKHVVADFTALGII